MASETLSVFSHPNFPQVFDSVMATAIRRVDTIFAEAALDRIRQARLLDPGVCCHSEERSCRNRATVSDLSTGEQLCKQHFGRGIRG